MQKALVVTAQKPVPGAWRSITDEQVAYRAETSWRVPDEQELGRQRNRKNSVAAGSCRKGTSVGRLDERAADGGPGQ